VARYLWQPGGQGVTAAWCASPDEESRGVGDGCTLEGCELSVWLTEPLLQDAAVGNVPGVYHASLHYLGAWGAEARRCVR
jgi:hypothetical protein